MKKKVYTKIVIDLETGKVKHAEGYWYDGPWALCEQDDDSESDQSGGLGADDSGEGGAEGGGRGGDSDAGMGGGDDDVSAHGFGVGTVGGARDPKGGEATIGGRATGLADPEDRGFNSGADMSQQSIETMAKSLAPQWEKTRLESPAKGILGKLGLSKEHATVAQAISGILGATMATVGTIEDRKATFTENFTGMFGRAPTEKEMDQMNQAMTESWGGMKGLKPGEAPQFSMDTGYAGANGVEGSDSIKDSTSPIDDTDDNLRDAGYSDDDIKIIRDAPAYLRDMDPYLLMKIFPAYYDLAYVGKDDKGLQRPLGGSTSGVERTKGWGGEADYPGRRFGTVGFRTTEKKLVGDTIQDVTEGGFGALDQVEENLRGM